MATVDRLGAVRGVFQGEYDEGTEAEYTIDFGPWFESQQVGAKEPWKVRERTLTITSWDLAKLPRSLPAVVAVGSPLDWRNGRSVFGPYTVDLFSLSAVTGFARRAEEYLTEGQWMAERGAMRGDIQSAIAEIVERLRYRDEPKVPDGWDDPMLAWTKDHEGWHSAPHTEALPSGVVH